MTLKELRKIKGLTQGGLAAALGLSASAIAKVESGRGNVSENMLTKIKEVYGIDLNADSVPAAEAEAEPAAPKKTTRGKKPEPAAEKKATRGKKAEPAAEKKSSAGKKEEKAATIIIQSVMGGEITADEIMARIAEYVGAVDKIYIKPEENRAYWVKGSESGCINLW